MATSVGLILFALRLATSVCFNLSLFIISRLSIVSFGNGMTSGVFNPAEIKTALSLKR